MQYRKGEGGALNVLVPSALMTHRLDSRTGPIEASSIHPGQIGLQAAVGLRLGGRRPLLGVCVIFNCSKDDQIGKLSY